MKLNEIHIRDPFVLVEDGQYYLYGTRGEGCWDTCSGFDVYVGDDLENWSGPISVFESSPDFWGTKQFWAPEVHKYKGKYYMFASFCAEEKCRATHILVSDSPTEKFVPLTAEPSTPAHWECLDGTFYVSKAGIPYMVFCHEWLQVSDGEIWAQQLSEDLKEAVGQPMLLFKASDPQWATEKEPGKYVTDGPYLYRHSDSELFLIWSTYWDGRYIEAFAVSSNGDIDGKWIHSDSFVFDQDGGHGMLFRDNDQALRFIMHAPNISPQERPVLMDIAVKDGCLGAV